MTKTLEITLTEYKGEKILHIKAINEDRLTHHGFGTFLENIEPKEIWITKEAKALLLEQPERGGLQELEFWPDHRLAWATPHPEIYVRPDDVNVPKDAKKWIKQMSGITNLTPDPPKEED